MTYNMFYCMFALMLFLHLQRAIPADKIRKSKGHGGYEYGGIPVPWGPGPGSDMLNILCHYCRIHPGPRCINTFCQNVPGFIGYAGRIGGYRWEWFHPDPHRLLCHYCWNYGNRGCLRHFWC